MKFYFCYKGKKYSLEVKECRSFLQKASGLMFRSKSRPLLFIWNKKCNEAIHSFFCVSFVAVWFDEDKIVDIRYVRPWRVCVKSPKNFDKLLEIPVSDKNFEKFKLLIDE